MPDATGLSSLAAFKKDRGEDEVSGVPSYPQAPVDGDLGANSLVPFTHESFSYNVERNMDPALLGGHAATPSDVIAIDCPGEIGGRLRFVGWARFFLCAMGFEYQHSTNGSPKDMGSGAYAHLLEMDDVLQDQAYSAGEREAGFHANDRKVRRGQVGFAKQVQDWIFGSVMFDKFTINGKPNEITALFGGIGYSLYRGDYSSDTWTEKTGTKAEGLFQSTTIKLSRRSDAPGSMTTISSDEFELVSNSPLRTDDRTTESAPNIEIPVRESFKDVTLKLSRPRFSGDYDDTIIDYWQQDQEFSSIVTITGPLIGGAVYYKYKFCLPSLKPIGPIGVNIEGTGPLAHEWNFRAFRPSPGGSDPFTSEYEGITLIKDSELRMMIYNTENVNYLTEV